MKGKKGPGKDKRSPREAAGRSKSAKSCVTLKDRAALNMELAKFGPPRITMPTRWR